jgi:hypothetical protein
MTFMHLTSLMLSELQLKILFALTLLGCLAFTGPAGGQALNDPPDMQAAENKLKQLFSELGAAGTPEDRASINSNISGLLGRILLYEDSFEYPFDSLASLGRIVSRDNLLRVFTWNYSDSPVDHRYSGFIQYRENDSTRVFSLNQVERKRDDLESRVFVPESWYGALYYQVHDVVHSGRTFYTLIGFDFNNVFTNIKMVDVLSFQEGSPVFGAPLFQFRDGVKNRVVFEYSSRAVMLLRYVPEREMIIYDHLAPGSPRLRGQYRYYGPVFSYDGLRFERGRWIHQQDVDWRP